LNLLDPKSSIIARVASIKDDDALGFDAVASAEGYSRPVHQHDYYLDPASGIFHYFSISGLCFR